MIVTEHAIDRYLERRRTTLTREQARQAIVDLLARHRGPLPPAYMHPDAEQPSRRFKVGGYAIVTDAACTTVITLYRWSNRPQDKRRAVRRARRTRARRNAEV